MGLHVYLEGSCACVRCKQVSNALFQTKLLRHEYDNCERTYRVGDTEIVDGLDGYCPLHPWDGYSPLVVAAGDWECEHCGLHYQWVKVVFEVQQVAGRIRGTITELGGLQPSQVEHLTGIHFVESDLADLSGFWTRPPHYNWFEGLDRWSAAPVQERCERVAAGFRAWCREVAEIDVTD